MTLYRVGEFLVLPQALNEQIDGGAEVGQRCLFPLRGGAEINVVLMRAKITLKNKLWN